jgi:hypothetical protein
MRAAANLLADTGIDLGAPLRQVRGWMYLCYCIAWAYPNLFTYNAESFSFFDDLLGFTLIELLVVIAITARGEHQKSCPGQPTDVDAA